VSVSGGPYELRPAFVSEDYEIAATVEGDGALTGSYTFEVWEPDGTAVASGLSVSITDADERELTAVATGLDLEPGVYRWSIRRTDSGARHVVAWGTLCVSDEESA
jgi:hypothetical protein